MGDNIIIWLAFLTLGVAVGLVVILLVAAKIVAAVREIKGEAESREIKPQPFIVQESVQFATKTELAAVKKDIAMVDEDLNAMRREIVENGESRRISIEAKVEELRKEKKESTRLVHERINEVLKALARLEGKVNS